jgi:hypothetical protein
MRLTLRTLIAWLDDTLTPSEVRTIGQQVAESPFAKELVDRLQRVTRQRRLTYPGDLGTEATDSNLVAGYLDNELTPEQVAEFEKRCLTSDVHLAEVASVHQVLSLIGQKAKVPNDARLRMYRLVRGRETAKPEPAPAKPSTTLPPPTNATAKPAKTRQTPPAPKPPAVEPVSAWTSGVPVQRSAIERFGPAAGVLAAIALLLWAATYSLNSEGTRGGLASNGPNQAASKPVEQFKPVEQPDKKSDVPAPPAESTTKPEEPMPAELANPEDVGVFEAIQGVVLKPNADGSAWDRVEVKSPFKPRSRLLNLAPFRNTLKLGKDEVDLVDSTEVVLDDPDKDHSSRLELRRGQLVVRPAPGSTSFALRFEGKVLEITTAPGMVVGIERSPSLLPGQAEPAPARLRIYLPDGRAVLKAGEEQATLDGPGELSLQVSGKFGEKARQPIPAWVTETAPSGFNKEIGNLFVVLLRPGRTILSDLVEAMDDPQKDVKRMAVYALGSIGLMDQVVEVASRPDEPTVHKAAVEVLRAGLAMGGESAKSVHEALVRKYDEPWAEVTQRLIVGFRPEDAKDEATLIKLVEYLGAAPTRGTRQLALDNLRALTGRGDSLDYDPDNPEGKGLKAWQDLVRRKDSPKEARPTGTGIR